MCRAPFTGQKVKVQGHTGHLYVNCGWLRGAQLLDPYIYLFQSSWKDDGMSVLSDIYSWYFCLFGTKQLSNFICICSAYIAKYLHGLLQCTWKLSWFIRHLADVLYIFYSNLWNLIRLLGLTIRNVRCVWWLSWTLLLPIRCQAII